MIQVPALPLSSLTWPRDVAYLYGRGYSRGVAGRRVVIENQVGLVELVDCPVGLVELVD